MRRSKMPSKRVLKQLLNGLEEIINEFGWAGFSEGEEEVARDTEFNADTVERADVTDDDGEIGEYESHRSRFPREDIEIGIDQFNSLLIKAKIVRKRETGRQPSLWQVFATLYGEDDPILKTIDTFEDHIKGYFGFIEYDEMHAAFNDILEVRDRVQKDLEAANV